MSMPYEIKCRLHRIFLERIRTRREELGLSQSDVADRMKASRVSYAQIEAGRRTPSLEIVERVAKALRIDAAELLSQHSVANT